jgi:hypothetical protein
MGNQQMPFGTDMETTGRFDEDQLLKEVDEMRAKKIMGSDGELIFACLAYLLRRDWQRSNGND